MARGPYHLNPAQNAGKQGIYIEGVSRHP
jgi:hypothetical protein